MSDNTYVWTSEGRCYVGRAVSQRLTRDLALEALGMQKEALRRSTASKLKPEFDQRNVKVAGLSVDTVDDHEKWASDIEETQGAALNFRLIGDPQHTVAHLYGMIHPNASDTLTVRSVFIIGPDKKVKLTLTYPASTGRNFAEILRVIDSLQLTADHKVATPADWKDGEDVIIVPALSDDEAKKKFPKGSQALKPYLRVTPQPNK